MCNCRRFAEYQSSQNYSAKPSFVHSSSKPNLHKNFYPNTIVTTTTTMPNTFFTTTNMPNTFFTITNLPNTFLQPLLPNHKTTPLNQNHTKTTLLNQISSFCAKFVWRSSFCAKYYLVELILCKFCLAGYFF